MTREIPTSADVLVGPRTRETHLQTTTNGHPLGNGSTQFIEPPSQESIQQPRTKEDQALDLFAQNGNVIEANILIGILRPGENVSPRAREKIIQEFSNQQMGSDRAVRYVNRKGESPMCKLVDIGPVVLPNGERIKVKGDINRTILKLMSTSGREGIGAKDAYGEDSFLNEMRLIRASAALGYGLIKSGSDYLIGRYTDKEKLVHFFLLLKSEKKVVLPTGREIKGIPPLEAGVLKHFIASGLPIYMDRLHTELFPNRTFADAKDAFSRMLSTINRALREQGQLKRVTKRHGKNPAYMLMLPENQAPLGIKTATAVSGERQRLRPHESIPKEDQYRMFRKMRAIRELLDRQKEDPSLELLDEVNAKLKKELEKMEGVMLNIHSRLVPSARIRFIKYRGNLSNEDIDQEGFESLIKAIRDFDPDGKGSFYKFATERIVGSMKRAVNVQQTNRIRVPERNIKIIQTIKRAQNDLSLAWGREVGFQEAMEHLNIPETLATIIRIARSHAVELDSLDAPITEDGRTLGEFIPDSSTTTAITPRREHLEQEVRRILQALNDPNVRRSNRLTDFQLRALQLYFNLTEEGDMSFSQVGEVMNKSEGNVVDFVQRAIRKLRDSVEMQSLLQNF